MLKVLKEGITAPKGFKAAGVKAGIKKSGNPDVAIIFSTVSATAAAVFTQNSMAASEIVLDIDLGASRAQATVWTCDFSYDYVKINGDYHT